MRLHEFAHTIDVVIDKIPQIHRPAILAWIVERWNPETGEMRKVNRSVERSIWCDDCPDEGTGKCDDCNVPPALDDTEVVDD